MFKKATKHESKLRLALDGPSGSGKTYTALNIAQHFGGKIALIDTERGSASKYADLFDFDVLELKTFHPNKYVEAIRAAEDAGYAVLIIDSLSHAWTGKGGALELVDEAARKSDSKNSFVAWREVTPLHNALVDAMLGSNLHLIVTMRTKTAYSQEKDDRGKTVIRKVGLEPIQRDGMEYEFDVVAELTHENEFIVQKSRAPSLHGVSVHRAGKEIADQLTAWLAGEKAPELPKAPPQTRAQPVVDRPLKTVAKTEGVLNDNQRTLVITTQKQNGISDEDFKVYLKAKYGISSRNDIPARAVDAVLRWLRQEPEPEEFSGTDDARED
jgi:hypothetical protein